MATKRRTNKNKGSVKEQREPRKPYVPLAGKKDRDHRYGCGGKKSK